MTVLSTSLASRLGLFAEGGISLSGEYLEEIDIAELAKIIDNISIFYRVTPRHKLKIVKVSLRLCLILKYISDFIVSFFVH